MYASNGETQFPTLCECIVRTATELGDPFHYVVVEKSPSKLGGNMSAYTCLGFPNTSSNHLDTDEFGFPMEKTKRSTGVFLTRFQNHFSLKIRKAQDIGDKTVLCSMWGETLFPKSLPGKYHVSSHCAKACSLFLVCTEAEMNWNFIRFLILMTFSGPLWKLINMQWVPCC